MSLDFLRHRQLLIPATAIALLFLAQISGAETVKVQGKALTNLVISGNKGSELQLEVRQMPLARVLDAITHKTQVPIHYSVLPEGLVTATCVGTALKQVLECLLDRKADLIVRYQRGTDSKEQLAEAWILGSRLDGTSAKADCPAAGSLTDDKGSFKFMQNRQSSEQAEEAEPDQTDQLLKMAQSKNPEERADAIGAMLAEGREDDPHVKAVLEQALTDQDASVRAQAISTLAHREGSEAAGAIQQAMQDSSVDVRLMAVDGTDDVALLQQAMNDNDETVRSLAAMKLEELTQKSKQDKE